MRTVVLCAAALLGTALAAAVCAEPAPAFEELIIAADRTAPLLREAESNIAAAQGRAQQAAARRNPSIGLEVENVGGNGAYRGSAARETTLAVTEPVELGGQRRARGAAAEALVGTATARRDQTRSEFAYALALAYADAEAAQSLQTILADNASRAREDVATARALVDAGKEAELRVLQAEAESAAAQARLDEARAALIQALARLTSMVGATEPFTAVTGSLLSRTSSSPVADGSTPTPAMLTARAELTAADRALTFEQSRAKPVLGVSLGVREFAAGDDRALVGGVSVPLPLFDRNRGAIAAARAEQDAARARLAMAELEASASAASAVALATAARARATSTEQAAAAAREAYRLGRIAYEAGRSSLLELQSARRALADAETAAVNARVARVAATAELARLRGRVPFLE